MTSLETVKPPFLHPYFPARAVKRLWEHPHDQLSQEQIIELARTDFRQRIWDIPVLGRSREQAIVHWRTRIRGFGQRVTGQVMLHAGEMLQYSGELRPHSPLPQLASRRIGPVILPGNGRTPKPVWTYADFLEGLFVRALPSLPESYLTDPERTWKRLVFFFDAYRHATNGPKEAVEPERRAKEFRKFLLALYESALWYLVYEVRWEADAPLRHLALTATEESLETRHQAMRHLFLSLMTRCYRSLSD